ncbi:MAG: hypothetical protein AABY22_19755 [Nanoarchaeota archaeon]
MTFLIKWRKTNTGWYPEVYEKISESFNNTHYFVRPFGLEKFFMDIPKEEFDIKPEKGESLHPIYFL